MISEQRLSYIEADYFQPIMSAIKLSRRILEEEKNKAESKDPEGLQYIFRCGNIT